MEQITPEAAFDGPEKIIEKALSVDASDVHMVGNAKGAAIIFRVDGELMHQANISKKIFLELIARIKIMAKLKLDEHFMPQDGRFRLGPEKIDVRVSIVPTIFSASVVLRIINSKNKEQVLNLALLGFSEKHIHILNSICKKKHGFILVTGPTGSGKTTTLHSLLTLIDRGSQSLITIEDPIEYELEKATQIQVQERIGLTFPVALRSVLRQDPDVIAIGEMRDEITAHIACHAALTGHQVYSTIHTAHAVQTITRLLEMGIKPYVIASALSCIVSQRLVHKICSRCSKEPPQYDSGFSQKTKTCSECLGKGIRGRMVIAEILEIDTDIKALIRERAPENVIREVAIKNGFEPFSFDIEQKTKLRLIKPYALFESI